MFRGILSTIYVDLNKGVRIRKLENTLKSQYSKNRFVKILKTNSLLSTNDVINTNNCSIVICKTRCKNRVIILSVIDNLIKGGAGQAIQNMNIKYGFNETKGLI
jgi:N-acetyl-gamma-glutamyl-phosphate reductase